MLKKTDVKDIKIESDVPMPSEEINSSHPENMTSDELGRLRDILFGSQSRTMEKRLGDLESDLKKSR